MHVRPETLAIRIIRRRPEHEADLFRLYGDVFGADMLARSRARWKWQFFDNPNNADDGPVIWMAVENERPLGQMATMPVWIWWGDREVRASVGMDYFVAASVQGRGVGIALSETWAAHVDVALALGLTPSSYPLFRKIFTDVGPVPAYIKPMDGGAVVGRRWGSLAGRVAGPILGLGLTVFSRRTPRVDGIEVRPVACFGDEYDDLWQRARGSYAAVVRRDARYLAWKYLHCPYRVYRVLEARMRGRLTGFIVLRQEGASAFLRGVIADLFCDVHDTATQDALVDVALDDFKSKRTARVETYCQDARLGDVFSRHGFRAGRTTIQYCVAHRHAGSGPLLRRAEWSLMLGDGDLDRA
jgi:GNAT superfamily N-acetyltransferase